MLKVTISGSYRTADRDIVDFEGVTGLVPDADEDIVAMHVRRRHAPMWIGAETDKDGNKKYNRRVHSIRECFVDDMEKVDGTPSYVGKDIKEMTYEELQDLALGKDLRNIPLFKKASLRVTRERAYLAYSGAHGQPVDDKAEGYNYAKLPKLLVDGAVRRETEGKISNETLIQLEQNSTGNPKDTMTLEDLKKVADGAGIKYHHNIGIEKLRALVLGASAPAAAA